MELVLGGKAVYAPFRFEIDCLSTLDLDAPPERPLTLELLRDDGQRRPWHGLYTEAAFLSGDGGLTRLQLTMGPWAALLGLRYKAVIFKGLEVRAVCERIPVEYPHETVPFNEQPT